MGKKVLIITSSMRKGSNSDALAEEFAKGVLRSGNTVETVTLKDKKIGFCRGCFACQKTGKCVIGDDGNEIAAKMLGADVLVFATPIYYYEMSGQLKTMLDRANPLFSLDYKFRDIYMLTTAADTDELTDEKAISGLEGWISCFPKARCAGSVFGGGVNMPGEIKGGASLEKAFEMGRGV